MFLKTSTNFHFRYNLSSVSSSLGSPQIDFDDHCVNVSCTTNTVKCCEHHNLPRASLRGRVLHESDINININVFEPPKSRCDGFNLCSISCNYFVSGERPSTHNICVWMVVFTPEKQLMDQFLMPLKRALDGPKMTSFWASIPFRAAPVSIFHVVHAGNPPLRIRDVRTAHLMLRLRTDRINKQIKQ